MVISACAIVKNEASNMPVWLTCVREFADEIIVVDTGSEDNTAVLAEKAGAKVFSFPWIGDFSAAKNFALDKANGDWIVFLDADEYFPASEVEKLRPLIQKYHYDLTVAGIMMRMDNIDKDTKDNLGTSFYQIRVFRRVPWLRYEGRIHEQLKNLSPQRKTKMMFEPDIVIYHTGYSASLARQKAERNLAMIKENQMRYGVKPLDDFHLADCYYSLHDWGQAAHYARKAIKNGVKAIGQENRPYAVLIQSLMLSKAPAIEIENAIRDAIDDYPEAAEFWMLWGIWEWDEGKKDEAVRYLKKGWQIYEDNARQQGGRLLANLCLNLIPAVHLRLGNYAKSVEKAAPHYVQGLKFRPRDLSLLRALFHVWPVDDAAGLIEILNHVYDKKTDSSFLVQVLKNSRHHKAALYYDRFASVLEEWEKYLLAGRVSEAAAWVLAESERHARIGLVMQERLTSAQRDMFGTVLPVGVKEKLADDGYEGAQYQEILGRVDTFLRENKER